MLSMCPWQISISIDVPKILNCKKNQPTIMANHILLNVHVHDGGYFELDILHRLRF